MTSWNDGGKFLSGFAESAVFRLRGSPSGGASASGEPPEAASNVATDRSRSRRPARRPKVLIVTTLFELTYRALRCAHASGADVYVLGNPGAKELRYSRLCKGFFRSASIVNGQRDENLALEINCLARQLGVQTVLPGCAHSTRALIASRDLIEPNCFPLPDLWQFDLLNNKWRFTQLCEQLGILHPATRLLPDAKAFSDEIAAGRLDYPLVAKPLDWSGGGLGFGGVLVFKNSESASRLNAINYQPVLAQNLIPGRDIGASIFARAGKIEAFVAHEFSGGIYSTFHSERIFADLARIAAHLDLNGVYNFDMILAPDNSIHYLECNPRFFYKMDLSMIAGINFVAFGLRDEVSMEPTLIPDGAQVRQPKALLASLASFGCSRRDWALAHYHAADPVAFLLQKLGIIV